MRLHRPLTRRRWLAAAAALALPALGAARADDGAAGVDDGAARRRPLAVKGVLLDIARAGQRLPRDRCVLVGVDGSLVTGSQGGEKLAFRRLEDRSTLTGAVALANGALAVTSTVGVRLVEGVT